MSRSRKQKEESIEALLARLSLTTASRELSRLLSESESVTHGEFLERVLALEVAAREERRRKRTLNRARLKNARGLAELDFSARKELSPTLLTELGTCRFIEERRNVVILGSAGTGKSTLAEALALATFDPLLDNATVLRFSGPSIRKPRDICELGPNGEVKRST